MFSPRVLGVAVARYDFFSRDAQELSLLQGDVIRVYSKSPNGWWEGEVDGRVGLLRDQLSMMRLDTFLMIPVDLLQFIHRFIRKRNNLRVIKII